MKNLAGHELFQHFEGLLIAQLLQQLELSPRYLAVERNEQLVTRGEHADCLLKTGDRIEIVTLVGGG